MVSEDKYGSDYQRRGEDEGGGHMLQVNADLLRDGDKTAIRRNGFGQRAGPDVDVGGGDSIVLVSAAAGGSQDTRGMRLVDHQIAAEFLLQGNQFREPADIAIHGKDTVGDDERAAGRRAGFQFPAQRGGIIVREAAQGDAGQAAGVH